MATIADLQFQAQNNDWTAVVVGSDAQILETQTGSGLPRSELVEDINARWPGVVLKFLFRRVYSESELQKLVLEASRVAAVGRAAHDEMPAVARRNIELHGDPGPFLVARRARLSVAGRWGAKKGRCLKCRREVWIPNSRRALWFQTGAAVVCAYCARSWPGRVLEAL